MSYVPEISILLTYSAACFVLFMTPGPDMSLFLARTVVGGRRAGLASMLGASLGCLIHTALAAVGLSALIAASPTAFTVMKFVGAGYLAWLAIDAMRNGSALNVSTQETAPPGFWRTFWLGVAVNLANPKVILFFVTFLPQFVSAADPHVAGKLAFLGVYFVAFSIPLCVMLILGAERVIANAKHHPGLMRAIDYIFAGVFGAFAVKILLTESK